MTMEEPHEGGGGGTKNPEDVSKEGVGEIGCEERTPKGMEAAPSGGWTGEKWWARGRKIGAEVLQNPSEKCRKDGHISRS